MKFPLVLVIVSAIIARLAMLALVDPLATLGLGDGAYYIQVGQSLARYGTHAINGVATYYRPPGYPGFLAAIFVLTPSLIAPFFVQGCVGIATAAISYFALGRRRLALGTALLVATSPFLIVVEEMIYAEAILIASLWLAWLALYGRWKGGGLVAGLLLGAAILTRETLLLLPLGAVPCAFLLSKGLGKKMAVAALVAYLAIAPWHLRNAMLPGGRFAMSEGRMGYNLWVGTWERDNAWFLPGVANANYPDFAFTGAKQRAELVAAQKAGNDEPFKQAAMKRIKENPGSVVAAWVTRYWRLWLGSRLDAVELRLPRGSVPWIIVKAAGWALNIVVLLAGFAGLLLAVWRRDRLAIFAIPVLYIAAISVPFHNVETRYSLPTLPFLYLFGAYAVLAGLRRRAKLGKVSDDAEPKPSPLEN